MAKTATARKRSMSGFIGANGGLPAAPVNTVAPTITGTAQVGATLTAVPGTWTGTETPVISYQWNVAGAAVAGATASTFVPAPSAQGSTVTVTVTGTNWAGDVSVTSAATSTVAAAG
jgi:hypothetical protein